MASSRTSIPTSSYGKKKRKIGKMKMLGAGLTPSLVYDYADIMGDMGISLGQEIARSLGLYKKGGKISKGPKGCGAAMKGYGKAMKGKN